MIVIEIFPITLVFQCYCLLNVIIGGSFALKLWLSFVVRALPTQRQLLCNCALKQTFDMDFSFFVAYIKYR